MAYVAAHTKTLPTTRFRNLAALDRYRNLCLWLPIENNAGQIAWGYKVDPNDSKWLLPEEKARICYVQAKKYLKENSYQVVSEWLAGCGYPVSPWGLCNMIKERPVWPQTSLEYPERLKLCLTPMK